MTDRTHAIDLTRHHFKRELGELTLYGTWLYNDDQEDYEPALVIIPTLRRTGFKPCVVALSAAWKYNDDARYLAYATRIFMRDLGMTDCLTNAHKLGSLIYDHLGDLVTMPPSPTSSILVGEAVVDIGGKKRTIQLLDHEPLQQL
jgi:hypothetical protein